MTEPVITEAVAPLAAELLRAARQEADEIRKQASDEAAECTAAAHEQAAELLAAARAEGAAEGDGQARTERIRTEREARRLVLTAQREALDELRSKAREAARGLQDDQALLARLRVQVRDLVGEGVLLTEHPDGGIVGEAPGRRVDAGLQVLADRMIDALGAEVERLWLP